jgi:hypothetical protein
MHWTSAIAAACARRKTPPHLSKALDHQLMRSTLARGYRCHDPAAWRRPMRLNAPHPSTTPRPRSRWPWQLAADAYQWPRYRRGIAEPRDPFCVSLLTGEKRGHEARWTIKFLSMGVPDSGGVPRVLSLGQSLSDRRAGNGAKSWCYRLAGGTLT